MTTDTVGGVWDFTVELATEAVRAGSRVTVLAFGSPDASRRSRLDRLGVPLYAAPYRLEWMADSEADVRASRRLIADLARALDVDVVHANQFGVLPRRLRLPSILTAHSDVLSWRKWTGANSATHDEWEGYRALVRDGLRRATEVVAVSGFVASELVEHYFVDRRIRVILNGWTAGRAAPTPFSTRPRQTLLAGRVWDEAKNIPLAARAAAGWDPGRVLVAGSTTHPESLATTTVDPPLELLGFQPRPALDVLLDGTRVFLSPARYEPFGLLPLQAALAGCALLLSGIPSFRELWDGAAEFFRPDDENDLRARWARLLEDDEFSTELACKSYERAATCFTMTATASAYLRLYERLANHS
jgi:glycosyltransferase involved in cell wall biosynthesis